MVEFMDREVILDLMYAANIEITASAADVVCKLVALDLITFDRENFQPQLTEVGRAAIEKLDARVH
jgi:hypothetical protein